MFCSMDNTISTLSNYCQVCQFTVLYLWYFFLETNIQPNKIVNVKYSSKKVEKKVNKRKKLTKVSHCICVVKVWYFSNDNWPCLCKTQSPSASTAAMHPFIDCATQQPYCVSSSVVNSRHSYFHTVQYELILSNFSGVLIATYLTY